MKIMFSYKNMTQDVKEIKMNWNNAKTVILKNEDVQNELRLNETEYKIIKEIDAKRFGGINWHKTIKYFQI